MLDSISVEPSLPESDDFVTRQSQSSVSQDDTPLAPDVSDYGESISDEEDLARGELLTDALAADSPEFRLFCAFLSAYFCA